MYWSGPLYSNGMHDWIIMEIEYGTRVAHAIDNKDASGWDAIDDLLYLRWVEEDQRQ